MTADYIYTHDQAYSFLVYYFLPELSETEFRPDAIGDERYSVSQYMAALLLYESNYNHIILQIYDKEDAVMRPLRSFTGQYQPAAPYTRLKKIYVHVSETTSQSATLPAPRLG